MFGLQMIHEMDNLQREMEQLFTGFGFSPLHVERQQSRPYRVHDKGDALEVEEVLPGIDIDQLDISMLGRQLTVSGKFAAAELPEGTTWHRRERNGGQFEKRLQLPANVESDKVEAIYEQGILKITLPKAASELPRKISVKAA